MIPRAEQMLPRFVPDSEGEVAQQVRHTVLTPGTIGPQNQLHIRGVGRKLLLPSRFELGGEVLVTEARSMRGHHHDY
jgi:hypothetical protein